MRPRLSYRDRLYITFLIGNVVALAASLAYWWRAAAI
jgi:hypothetical protein